VGIIRKQSIRGSIYTYIGVLLGFVTIGLLWPRFLSSEEIGLLSLIVAISAILVQIGSLGFVSAINRYFTMFRNRARGHHGFVPIMILVMLAGALVSTLLVLILKPVLIEQNLARSDLFPEFYYLIIPVFIAILFFNVLDAYLKLLYDAVTGLLLQELVLRISSLVLLLAYILLSFPFSGFAYLYSAIYYIPLLGILGVLLYRREFPLRPSRELLTRDMVRNLFSISTFGLIGGFGLIAVSNIDRIMINHMLDLHNTGIYSIAFLYGTIIIIPGRIVIKAATASISDGWKNNDLDLIRTIYYKTCVNQFIIALFLFLLLWLNINYILKIIPDIYTEGKYVIFFIAIAQVINMSTGANSIITATSKYYRFQAYFVILLLMLIVVTNLIFIPIYGIVGAALASAISTLIHNGVRYLFLLVKFRMQPFNYRYIIIALGTLIIYFGFKQISFESNNVYLDILITSIFSSMLFGIMVFYSRASDDINDRIITYRKIARNILRGSRERE
jgi:O-antigen/teichoic acid export membrane protein